MFNKKLNIKFTELEGEVKGVKQEIKGMNKTVDMIHESTSQMATRINERFDKPQPSFVSYKGLFAIIFGIFTSVAGVFGIIWKYFPTDAG